MSKSSYVAVILSLSMFLLPMAAMAASAVTPPAYSVSSLSQTGIKHTSIGGYSVVKVNYTSSFTAHFVSLVYLDLTNKAGQTVYVSIVSGNFSASGKLSFFLPLSSTLAAGNYTAKVFATSTSNVPVSTTGTLKFTV